MIVIKLGGSLVAANKILPCLDKIEQTYRHRKVTIVPGGGLFADQVRLSQKIYQFDDRAAHRMAILAMQQMAVLLSALKPNFKIYTSVNALLHQSETGICIWSPKLIELDNANIPSSWGVTSDSLSAWLAKALTADELIMVKSVKINPKFDVLNLVEQQILDASFIEFFDAEAFSLKIVHAEEFLSKP